ncbi:MAG: hypothetical protein J6Q94_09875 [Clostridia bacterium]|nr:hypothetical protein [Clostridia bacterium]
MDEFTQLIKKNIKLKYSSTKKFAEDLGIPHTTIVSSIKNGVGGTAFTTVCKMCKALGIKIANGIYPVAVNDNTRRLIEKLSRLDEKGIHTVTTVIEMEYIRCCIEAEAIAVAENKENNTSTAPVITPDQVPTKAEVTDLLKALNDDQLSFS